MSNLGKVLIGARLPGLIFICSHLDIGEMIGMAKISNCCGIVRLIKELSEEKRLWGVVLMEEGRGSAQKLSKILWVSYKLVSTHREGVPGEYINPSKSGSVPCAGAILYKWRFLIYSFCWLKTTPMGGCTPRECAQFLERASAFFI